MNYLLSRQKRIGILRGGESALHDVSVREGALCISFVLENMFPKWKPVDIYIDREGVWYLNGVPVIPSDIVNKVDLVWNLSTPEYSQILKSLTIPIIGHDAFLGLIQQPEHFSNFAAKNNIKSVRNIIFPVYQSDFDGRVDQYVSNKAREVWQKFSPPWIVRPYNTDRNVSLKVAKTFPMLLESIDELVRRGDSILVEELIPGKVVSAHVVPDFRGDKNYHFPILSPYPLSLDEKKLLKNTIDLIRKHIDHHYLKIDFIIHPRTGVHVLGFSLSPDLRENSHLEETCKEAGVRLSHVLGHIFEKVL